MAHYRFAPVDTDLVLQSARRDIENLLGWRDIESEFY